MGLEARLTAAENNPPGKFYVHTAGFDKVFGPDDPTGNSLAYVSQVMKTYQGRFNWYSFVIGIVWGDESNGDKVMDLFGYRGLKEWSGNPDVDLWVIRNGIYVPDISTTCGESLVVLGKEEEFRKGTKDLDEYFKKPLPVIRPFREFKDLRFF